MDNAGANKDYLVIVDGVGSSGNGEDVKIFTNSLISNNFKYYETIKKQKEKFNTFEAIKYSVDNSFG